MNPKKKTYLIFAIILVIVAGLSFVVGMKFQQKRAELFNRPFYGRGMMMHRGMMPFGFGRMQGNMINGQVINISGNLLTIKLQNGNSETVDLSNNTLFQTNQNILKPGQTISIFGPLSSNGNINAQKINIIPQATQTP